MNQLRALATKFLERVELRGWATPEIRLTQIHAIVGPDDALNQCVVEKIDDAYDEAFMGDNDYRLAMIEREPCTGMYPTKIHDEIQALRRVAWTRQVIVVTSNPLVLNEFAPEEASLVTMQADGSFHCNRFSDMPRIDAALEVWLLGEFWVNYCDGQHERPLLEGKARE